MQNITRCPEYFSASHATYSKKLLVVFDSADFCNLALFTFCTAADCHCLFVLLSDADCYYWETKGKPSLICPWSHCQQTSATFLCLMFCCCMMLIAAACTQLHLQTFYFFFMISTRCLLMLSADTYYCNTYYKRSAAYACCLHQVFLRTPLKKGRCSRTPRNSWNRHSLGEFTNTT